MSFEFRFERVLAVRRIQEKSAHEEWHAARQRVRAREEAFRTLRAEIVLQREDLSQRQLNGGLPAAQIIAAYASLDRVEARLRRMREEIKTLNDQAERLREPWEERRRERKSLERLREREKDAWYGSQRLMQAGEMDEIARMRSDAGRRAGGEAS